MEGQGAEGAGTEAAAVGDKAELDLLNGGDTALLLIAWVVGPAVGKAVDIVHLLPGKGLLGRILDHIQVPEGLRQPLGGERVAVVVLNFEGFGVGALVLLQCFIGGQHDGGQTLVQLLHPEDGAVDVGDVPDIHAGVQCIGDLDDAPFAHAVEQQVRLGVQEDGALHALGPVVVVTQAAQAGLNAADDDGRVLVGLADQIAVDHRGVVGPLAHLAAGGVGIGLPAVLGDGIVVDHGVHIAAGNQEAQTGLAVNIDGGGLAPVGLGDDAHLITGLLQNS